jgi:hypothetical protein
MSGSKDFRFEEADFDKKQDLLRKIDFAKDDAESLLLTVKEAVLKDNLQSCSADDLLEYCSGCRENLSKQHFGPGKYYVLHCWLLLADLFYKARYPSWTGQRADMLQACDEARKCVLIAMELDARMVQGYDTLLSTDRGSGKTPGGGALSANVIVGLLIAAAIVGAAVSALR